MTLHRYFGRYILAVYSSWVSLVSGVGSVVLLILLAFWGNEYAFIRDNKKTFVWLAIICLIITSFVVWLKERKSLEAEQAVNERPDIRGEIKDVIETSTITSNQVGFDYFYTVRLYLVNERATTNIQDFTLKLFLKDKEFKATRLALNRHYLERQEPQSREAETNLKTVQHELKDLYKSKDEPLVKGIGRDGWVRFAVLNVPWKDEWEDDNETRIPKRIELTIIDANGSLYVFTSKPPWDTEWRILEGGQMVYA